MNVIQKTIPVAVLVTLGLTSSGNAAEGWPRWHGPLGTGQTPDTPSSIAEAPAGGLKPIWSVPCPGADRGNDGNSSIPVIADGKVYVHWYVTKARPAGMWSLHQGAVEAIGRDRVSSAARKTVPDPASFVLPSFVVVLRPSSARPRTRTMRTTGCTSRRSEVKPR
jgi:hypothetical protein